MVELPVVERPVQQKIGIEGTNGDVARLMPHHFKGKLLPEDIGF